MSHTSTIEPVLRAVEPALRLVHERHLRQVLHFLIDRGRALPTNTELPFWLTRADLAAADVLPRETLQGANRGSCSSPIPTTDSSPTNPATSCSAPTGVCSIALR